MATPWFIDGSKAARPASRRTIYCDGGCGDSFRTGHDLHLSHWLSNRTPAHLKADTSTGICLAFAGRGDEFADFDLIVNDHVDVDGTLSVFVLVHPELALAHADLLVQAAAMGDFWAWGEGRAQLLFQGLTQLIDRMDQRKADPGEIVGAGFDCIRQVLDGNLLDGVEEGLAALRDSVDLIDRGAVRRTAISERLTLFEIPRALSAGALQHCLFVPGLNTPLSRAALLWPHARARLDRERLHLVSVQADRGWYHDLWLPGYSWAETPTSRPPPGLDRSEGGNLQRFAWPPFDAVVEKLQHTETAPGRWLLATQVSPFVALEGRGFPVVLSFMHDGAPAPSRHAPGLVAGLLGEALP